MYHRYDIKVFQKGSESVSFIGNVSSALCFVLVISQIYLNFRHSSGQIKSLNVLFSFWTFKVNPEGVSSLQWSRNRFESLALSCIFLYKPFA